jgi:hypothetical protein
VMVCAIPRRMLCQFVGQWFRSSAVAFSHWI